MARNLHYLMARNEILQGVWVKMNVKELWLDVFRGKRVERIPYAWEPFPQGKGFSMFCSDPVSKANSCLPDGKEHPDSWGVMWQWMPGAPSYHPHITEENKVLKDITKWKEQVVIPDLEHFDWQEYEDAVAQIDREKYFVMPIMAMGIFERVHSLMGFEEALIAFMTNPEEMKELVKAIADYRIRYVELLHEHLHPDIIHYHDDWGTMQSVFLPPAIWRDIIKPQQKRIADKIHECGMIYMHHSDSVCSPYLEDMIEIGIDIWQGVIPQEDIPAIQKAAAGRIGLLGGIDGPTIDRVDQTEDAIRAEVRRAIDSYCPGGCFIPCIPNIAPFTDRAGDIMKDEMIRYGKIWCEQHRDE